MAVALYTVIRSEKPEASWECVMILPLKNMGIAKKKESIDLTYVWFVQRIISLTYMYFIHK